MMMTPETPSKPEKPKSAKALAKHQGMRLDQFLAEALDLSRKRAKLLIDQGRVFQGDKKIIIGSWEVQAGDLFQVKEPGDTGVTRRSRYLKIYHEDQDILVVEKPTGVACERTPQTLTSTLVDDINDYLRRAHPRLEYPYVGLMHRLDRSTSGLMIYTLSKRANALAEQFKTHRIGRRYIALVEGKLPKNEGVIEKAIVKDPESGGKKMKALAKNSMPAQRAVTRFRVLERYPNATLIEAELETGRTHQVRVHLASLGHPVVGDKTYGSKVDADRYALHASLLDIRHPVTNKRMKFESKLPNDFQKLVDRLRAKAAGVAPTRPRAAAKRAALRRKKARPKSR